ncbi:aa3-type cytochrome c oxidase subunit IV [Asticcacaulis benevestitus]|uniref:Cytochrome c oxidase subunit IV bacterial aa3 type domain-containing protein n=1 Tax=Asticcacaulis benevestitus DSM 16100 = ATCC BAA-896 TaxID=1121022 RepID=V4PPT0_9CAUL|nr:aa3-type cytochrome c oxidase subunit IV [Asticcacaulis benevestitus]ESQ89324.1 hypothetical protein ABENE_14140 [Asticcacaulis benevestitus DSM 16100 = ATCC BAA-896]
MADPHDHSTDDYVRGEMDVHEHQHSFELFVNMTKWGSLVISVGLVFLIVLTSTKLGFITAVVSSVVVAGLGWVMLKKKPDTGH